MLHTRACEAMSPASEQLSSASAHARAYRQRDTLYIHSRQAFIYLDYSVQAPASVEHGDQSATATSVWVHCSFFCRDVIVDQCFQTASTCVSNVRRVRGVINCSPTIKTLNSTQNIEIWAILGLGVRQVTGNTYVTIQIMMIR